jgi:hypothetical protein
MKAFAFVSGLFLTIGAVGAISEMPPGATITQWTAALCIAGLGVVMTYAFKPE